MEKFLIVFGVVMLSIALVKLQRELEDLKRAREKGQELEMRLYSNLIGKVR